MDEENGLSFDAPSPYYNSLTISRPKRPVSKNNLDLSTLLRKSTLKTDFQNVYGNPVESHPTLRREVVWNPPSNLPFRLVSMMTKLKSESNSQDQLKKVLSTHEKLSFHMLGKLGLSSFTHINIRDASQEIIMTALITTSQPEIPDRQDRRNPFIISVSGPNTVSRFIDPAGRTIFTSEQTGDRHTIMTADGVLGHLRFAADLSVLEAQSPTKEDLFHMETKRSDYKFVSNDSIIAVATARKITGDDFELDFTPALDVTTRAILIAGTVFIHLWHSSKPLWGCGCILL